MENITSTCHCHLVSPPLFSNEPSVNVVNHTPSNKQKHFWNPARHEVETLYLVVVQWPMCSPDMDFEVVTKAIQLSLLSLFSSFLRCAANDRVSRGCVMNHYEIVKFSIKGVYFCVLASMVGLGQLTGSHILYSAAFLLPLSMQSGHVYLL